MIEKSQSSTALTYEDAIAILGQIGVFTSDFLFRDGHTTASFAASSIDVTGSTFSQREVSEKDWIRLLGHLLAEAAERGLRPAQLLAIGMATVLQVTTTKARGSAK